MRHGRDLRATLAVVAVAALVVVLAALALRNRPDSYPVGDFAILEIYTQHASRGDLTVGPYSRFGWNHPGPLYFYGLVPGYVLSGQREESLLATVLVFNVLIVGFVLAVLRRCGGWPTALAFSGWLLIYYLRPSEHLPDFADLLSSSWNPHVTLLPFLFLLVLASALAAGHRRALPALVAVASFVTQTHAAFLPLSLLIAGTAGAIWLVLHGAGWSSMATGGRVPKVAVALDVLLVVYVGLFAVMLVSGGFELGSGPFRLTVRSPDKLVVYIVVIAGLRHLISRHHPLIRRVLQSPTLAGARGSLGAPVPSPVHARRVALASVAVLAVAWCLPLVGEFAGERPGNLRRMIRSVGAERISDLADGLGGTVVQLSGVVHPGFTVAAGGRLLTADSATWPMVLVSLGQLVGLGFVLRSAFRRERPFLAAMAAIGLVASVGAAWASVRVGAELYDHLIVWVSMLGTFNLAVITVGLVDRTPVNSSRGARLASLIVPGVAIAALAGQGTTHILRGHHTQRFGEERQTVQRLASALAPVVSREDGPVRIALEPGTWIVTSGVILWLYQQGVEVTVADDWIPIYGPPLLPSGREVAEFVVVQSDTQEPLPPDAAHLLSDGDVRVYRRPLSPRP